MFAWGSKCRWKHYSYLFVDLKGKRFVLLLLLKAVTANKCGRMQEQCQIHSAQMINTSLLSPGLVLNPLWDDSGRTVGANGWVMSVFRMQDPRHWWFPGLEILFSFCFVQEDFIDSDLLMLTSFANFLVLREHCPVKGWKIQLSSGYKPLQTPNRLLSIYKVDVPPKAVYLQTPGVFLIKSLIWQHFHQPLFQHVSRCAIVMYPVTNPWLLAFW